MDGWIDGWMRLGHMSGEFFCCCCCADAIWQGPGARTGLSFGSLDAVAAVAAASGLGLAPQDQLLLLLLLSTSSSRHFKASRLLVCGARDLLPFVLVVIAGPIACKCDSEGCCGSGTAIDWTAGWLA